jgi:predicted amidohydrolase YtcJ
MRFLILSLILIAQLPAGTVSAQRACDMIFHHGIIHTLDAADSRAEAFAVTKGKVVEVGTDADIMARFKTRRRIDLQGRHVFPGFIDAHAHLYGIGEKHLLLPLRDAADKRGILAMVADASRKTPAGRWIRGRGWDQNTWPEKAFPEASELDAITTKQPVMLIRVDGHAAWVNSAALAIGGITASTPDPPGGKVLRKANGTPTGILLDEAVELVRSKIPPPTLEEREAVYTEAIAVCASLGITAMHDMGVHRDQIAALRSLIKKKRFPFRLTAYIDGRGDDWEALLRTGRTVDGDDQLVLNGLKMYADGALGSRGALLLRDYSDDPGNHGIPNLSRDSIREESIRALRRGLQVCVHAIGDSANRLVLDAYEEALRAVPSPHPPLRIEHAQVLAPADIPRFAALGVIPSMQPIHCTSDMYWAEARLGSQRVKGAYAWNSLLGRGSRIAAGSDAPVESPNPLWGMYAACTRRDQAGRPATLGDIASFFQLAASSVPDPARYNNGWYASEAVPVDDALRMYTRWAAEASGQQATHGSLEPGHHADFVILSEDITAMPESRIWKASVVATYVGGRQVFPAPK